MTFFQDKQGHCADRKFTSQLAEVEREYQRAEAEFDLAKRAGFDYRITIPDADFRSRHKQRRRSHVPIR